MKRVVVTGLGIVSSIGCTADEVAASLKAGRSGIRFSEEQARYGFKSQVSAEPALNPDDAADKTGGRMGTEGGGARHGQAFFATGVLAGRPSLVGHAAKSEMVLPRSPPVPALVWCAEAAT